MSYHSYDPGDRNKWYQSPQLGLFPTSPTGSSGGYYCLPSSHPPDTQFPSQPSCRPPPPQFPFQPSYSLPPPPPPSHTIINGYVFPYQFPSTHTYNSPDSNPNPWIYHSISQSHSYAPSVTSVNSHFVSTKTMPTPPIYHYAPSPSVGEQPHTLSYPNPLCLIPESDLSRIKLKGAEKPHSPPQGSGKLQESLKSSMDTFISEFREELRLLRVSLQSPASQVDNPLKFGSPPPSPTPELIPAAIEASSSLIPADNGIIHKTHVDSGLHLSHTDVLLRFNDHTSTDHVVGFVFGIDENLENEEGENSDKRAKVNSADGKELNQLEGVTVKEDDQGLHLCGKRRESHALYLFDKVPQSDGLCNAGRTIVAPMSIRDKGGGLATYGEIVDTSLMSTELLSKSRELALDGLWHGSGGLNTMKIKFESFCKPELVLGDLELIHDDDHMLEDHVQSAIVTHFPQLLLGEENFSQVLVLNSRLKATLLSQNFVESSATLEVSMLEFFKHASKHKTINFEQFILCHFAIGELMATLRVADAPNPFAQMHEKQNETKSSTLHCFGFIISIVNIGIEIIAPSNSHVWGFHIHKLEPPLTAFVNTFTAPLSHDVITESLTDVLGLCCGTIDQSSMVISNGHSELIVLLFNATFPLEVQRLAADLVYKDYIFLIVGRLWSSTDLIAQRVEFVRDMGKIQHLCGLLKNQRDSDTPGALALTLVFVETRKGVNAVTKALMELMNESKQEVPNWLNDYAEQSLSYGGHKSQMYGSSNFGGYNFCGSDNYYGYDFVVIVDWFRCAISELGTVATLNAWLNDNFLCLPLENKPEKVTSFLADKLEKMGHKRLLKKSATVMFVSKDGKYLDLGSKDGDIFLVEVKKMEHELIELRNHISSQGVVNLLEEVSELALAKFGRRVILLTGLQGVGKTTKMAFLLCQVALTGMGKLQDKRLLFSGGFSYDNYACFDIVMAKQLLNPVCHSILFRLILAILAMVHWLANYYDEGPNWQGAKRTSTWFIKMHGFHHISTNKVLRQHTCLQRLQLVLRKLIQAETQGQIEFVDYGVNFLSFDIVLGEDLFVVLQDGLRLFRAIQLLKDDCYILMKMVVPSDTNKKHLPSCSSFLHYLEAGIVLHDEGNMIVEDDSVDGDKELSISLVQNLFVHLQVHLLVKKTILANEICKIQGNMDGSINVDSPPLFSCFGDLALTMILYSLWLIRAWHKSMGYLPFEDSDYPTMSWFIYIFLGLGVTLCSGHGAADTAHGYGFQMTSCRGAQILIQNMKLEDKFV